MVRVYPIIQPRDVFERRACVEALCASGIKMLQIRSPDTEGNSSELLDAGRAIVEMLASASSGVSLMINDRVDIAKILEVGVHLGQNDAPSKEARIILGNRVLIGVSTHNPDEAAAVEDADYISVGPIFPTMSKHDAAPVVGLDTLRAVRARVSASTIIVAIGGITAHNFRSCIDSGATYVGAIGVFRDQEGYLSANCAEIAARFLC